jgi:nucleoside-diphosphate-sugar epimerase
MKDKTQKILILGATGAMGKYLVPLLADAGYHVDAVALEKWPAPHPSITSIVGNMLDDRAFRSEILAKPYDAIVDFMIYNTSRLASLLPEMPRNTGHYIFLSSYRVYADAEHPIRETSPRLIDATDDVLLRNSDDYSIYKARGENILRSFERRNWTIVRPAITYSLLRYQLVTLEAPNTVGRAFAGKPTVLPEQARNVQATMSWAGDVARMIAGLVFNSRAFGETFTVSTAEHRTWGEIAEYYRDICGLQAIWADMEDYLKVLRSSRPPTVGDRWQLVCDRLYDRIIDNSKILDATGLKQSELKPLYDGLEYEIGRCPRDLPWPENPVMDEFVAARGRTPGLA